MIYAFKKLPMYGKLFTVGAALMLFPAIVKGGLLDAMLLAGGFIIVAAVVAWSEA